MQNSSFADTMASSSRRRSWILLLAIAASIMFSWTSINGLNELVELQQLPDEPPISARQRQSNEISSSLALNKGTAFKD
jgi:hypothetical protein